jgi:hypothetical protein
MSVKRRNNEISFQQSHTLRLINIKKKTCQRVIENTHLAASTEESAPALHITAALTSLETAQ